MFEIKALHSLKGITKNTWEGGQICPRPAQNKVIDDVIKTKNFIHFKAFCRKVYIRVKEFSKHFLLPLILLFLLLSVFYCGLCLDKSIFETGYSNIVLS